MRVSITCEEPVQQAGIGVVFEREVWSSSDPNLSYFVRLHADGSWTCTCPGFLYQARYDGQCKHTDMVRADYGRALTLADLLV